MAAMPYKGQKIAIVKYVQQNYLCSITLKELRMASLFISYFKTDEDLAQRLEQHLVAKGHRVRIPVGTDVTGNRQLKYIKAIAASNVFVAVLSDKGLLESEHIILQTGIARAMEHTRGLLVLPVLFGEIRIPNFVSDLYCLKLNQNVEEDIANLAATIDKLITVNANLGPRIFISHRHRDEKIAAALVELLKQAFQIGTNDIRCTSVKPYTLTPGELASEQLRSDIARAELVIGILSPDTSESNYVLCELGASWGRDVPTFPVLVRGASYADVPSPLNERHSISLESEDNCLDLIKHVASKTSLQRKDCVMEELTRHVKHLADTAKMPSKLDRNIDRTHPVGPSKEKKNGRVRIR